MQSSGFLSYNGELTRLRAAFHIIGVVVLYVIFTLVYPTFPQSVTLFHADGFPITWNYLASMGMIVLNAYLMAIIGLKRFRKTGIRPTTYFMTLEIMCAIGLAYILVNNQPPSLPPPFQGVADICSVVAGSGIFLFIFSLFKRNKA